MKRSEVLDKIADFLSKHYTPTTPYNAAAEIILKELEEAGMLPPRYLKPLEFYEGRQYPLVPGDFKREDGLWGRETNEWEPEDE